MFYEFFDMSVVFSDDEGAAIKARAKEMVEQDEWMDLKALCAAVSFAWLKKVEALEAIRPEANEASPR